MAKRNKARLRLRDSKGSLGTPYDILDRMEDSLGKCNVKDNLSFQQIRAVTEKTEPSFFANHSKEEIDFRTKHDKCYFHITKSRETNSMEKLIFRFGPEAELREFTVRWVNELTLWQKEQISKTLR